MTEAPENSTETTPEAIWMALCILRSVENTQFSQSPRFLPGGWLQFQWGAGTDHKLTITVALDGSSILTQEGENETLTHSCKPLYLPSTLPMLTKGNLIPGSEHKPFCES